MAKFRCRTSKGKRWARGQASSSNPTKTKYRDLAQSRFFKENLGDTGLTQDALQRHDTVMAHRKNNSTQKSEAETELTIAKDLENMSMRPSDNDDEKTESEMSSWSQSQSNKTFKTFASSWSQCTNASFNKFFNKFDEKNALHKSMLAVLATATEIINKEGGKESNETYYAVLMIMLKTVQDDADLTATVALLAMGIKSVPQVVLRKMFSDSAKTFMEVLKKNMETASPGLLQNLIGCLSVLLRAQSYTTWGSSSTMDVFNHILGFTLYSKPWVRKVAQRAVHSVLVRSCFMAPEDENAKIPAVHPAAEHVAKFCLSQLTAKALVAGYRTVCYTLNILKLVLPLFTKKDIKTTCEAILALMAQNNVYIKTNALHALHELLAARGPRCQLAGATAAQLCRALAAARPAGTDAAQALAWAAVMQQAYSCLARLDLNLCLPNLPFFVGICVSELWLADLQKVNDAATNALKMLLVDCVKPAAECEQTFTSHKHHIETVIRSIGAGLDNPFNKAVRHVILTIAACFEIDNPRLEYLLGPLLTKLVERRETDNFHHQAEVECATGCAVKSLGPEFVLAHVQLRDGPESINLERSWLLPVLKKNITHSRLKYFSTEILQMATFCRKRSRELTAAQDNAGSHTYELLCNQLWSLLPSFCNHPTDIKDSFKEIAKLLGTVLKQNPEFRVSVMQGLRRLVACSADDERDRAELARFAKNYVPILLNLYLTPVTGNTAKGVSLATLETIQVYLTITDQTLQDEFYQKCLQSLTDFKDKQYQREATLDVIRLLVLYQDAGTLAKLFNDWLVPLCTNAPEMPKLNVKKPKGDQDKEEKEAKMDDDQEAEASQDMKKQRRAVYKLKLRQFEKEQKKAFRILVEMMSSERENCKAFCREYEGKIKELLLATATGKHAATSGKIWRLRCLELVIKSSELTGSAAEEQFLRHALAQAVVGTRDINAACRGRARALLAAVADAMRAAAGDAGVRRFMELLRAGLGAGEARVAAATLGALAAAAHRLAPQLGAAAMRALLADVLALMGREDTQLAAAAIAFLKMYIKAMERALVEDSLPAMMAALSSLPDACKRSSRTRLGFLLHAMLRKFGDAALRAAVPPGDAATLRRLRNLRKLESRKKTLKENRTNEMDETNSDLDAPMKAAAATIEDILRDSDSEMERAVEEEEEERPKKKPKTARKNSTWIQENADDIVDLADVSAARKITGTDPSVKRVAEDKTQKKKKECTFRTAPDGRLIISDDMFGDDDDEDKAGGDDDDSDSDDTDNEKVDPEKQKRLVKTGQKRRHDDAASVRSGASGRSGASARGGAYRPGGRGIHRAVGSSAAAAAAPFGAEYRAKKAQGDVTRRGRPQPYAYIPLDRKNMNKRNRHLNAKQFKGVVKAKTRVSKRKQR